MHELFSLWRQNEARLNVIKKKRCIILTSKNKKINIVSELKTSKMLSKPAPRLSTVYTL